VGLGLIEVCLPPAQPRFYSFIIRFSYSACIFFSFFGFKFAYNSTSNRPVAILDQQSRGKKAGDWAFRPTGSNHKCAPWEMACALERVPTNLTPRELEKYEGNNSQKNICRNLHGNNRVGR